jgi:YfiH family protein
LSFTLDPEGRWHAALLDALDGIEHGFGSAASTPPPGVLTLRQIHSARVVPASTAATETEGDALWTTQPGQWIGVRTADCVPILLAGGTGFSLPVAVAAVHAGWRGTVANIAAAAVAEICRHGSVDRQNLRAAIGPAIGACCYEVGPEVAAQFKFIFPERTDLDTRTRIGLAEANRRLLIAAGVPEWNISISGLCTACSSACLSWRRDRQTSARMVAAIRLRPR